MRSKSECISLVNPWTSEQPQIMLARLPGLQTPSLKCYQRSLKHHMCLHANHTQTQSAIVGSEIGSMAELDSSEAVLTSLLRRLRRSCVVVDSCPTWPTIWATRGPNTS